MVCAPDHCPRKRKVTVVVRLHGMCNDPSSPKVLIMRTTRVVRAFQPTHAVYTAKRPSRRMEALMHHGLIVTECASVAIGKGTRSWLCGITYVNAMATESILGDDRKVLAYLYHLCRRKYHASPGVGRGHMTCAIAQKNGGRSGERAR